MAQVVTSIANEFLQEIGRVDTLVVNTQDIYLEDSKEKNANATKGNSSTTLFLLLIACFAIGVIGSSIAHWAKSKNERSREKKAKEANAFSSDVKDGLSNAVPKENKRKEETFQDKFIRSFAVQENLGLLFKRRAPPEDANLEVLNGVRCILVILIIMGNTYLYLLLGPLQNPAIMHEWMESLSFAWVISGDLAVDIFFWLTAFLSVYFLLNKMHDSDGELGSAFKIIFNRYIRLFPLYFFSLFYFWKIMVLFGGEGPVFFRYSEDN